jgi:serine/threonine protein kinase
VYKARDALTGKIVALKKVRFDNLEPESVKFMAREILILRRLDHPNVVKLEGLVTSRMSCSLYLVFEYMEHDLAGLAASPTIKFTEPQVLAVLFCLFFLFCVVEGMYDSGNLVCWLVILKWHCCFLSCMYCEHGRSNAICTSFYLGLNIVTIAMCCIVI